MPTHPCEALFSVVAMRTVCRCQWQTLVIEDSPRGKQHPLHGRPCFGGSLDPVDLLRLLRAVEILIAGP